MANYAAPLRPSQSRPHGLYRLRINSGGIDTFLYLAALFGRAVWNSQGLCLQYNLVKRHMTRMRSQNLSRVNMRLRPSGQPDTISRLHHNYFRNKRIILQFDNRLTQPQV
jgi:hypothetical protein